LWSFVTNATPPSILYKTTNNYGSKWVFDEDNIRCLSFLPPSKESTVQTCFSLDKPDFLIFDYTKLMLAALYIKPDPQKILFIGLGGATIPKALMKLLPNVKIDVVEIDPEVIKIAKEYFSFSATDNIKIFEQDGVDFVKKAMPETYDIVFLDGFDVNYIPPAFLTREFTDSLKKILTKTGIACVNTFVASESYQLESQLYQNSFGGIINLIGGGNRVILVSNDQFPSHVRIVWQAEKWQKNFKDVGLQKEWLLGKFGLGYMSIVLPITHGFAV
jgi:spermidine synthase